jgi:ubiquinone/menaquinone biosynthesis C-methylase UbiE
MSSKAEALARSEAVFNSASDTFDHPALSFWNRFGQGTVDRLGLHPGNSVLDLCCGTGASALPAAVAVGETGRVLAIDIAEALLELGRRKARHLPQVEFCRGDFETLGLPDASFDAVVCVFGIFFVPDMDAAVRELWRMVRPGGKLAITSWGQQVFEPANRVFWQALGAERPDLVKQFTPWDRISDPQDLQALLETNGAQPVQVWSELGTHPLSQPEDWWTMAMGGGLRGTLDQLEPAALERLKHTNLEFLRSNKIEELEFEVLYAIAQKATGH